MKTNHELRAERLAHWQELVSRSLMWGEESAEWTVIRDLVDEVRFLRAEVERLRENSEL